MATASSHALTQPFDDVARATCRLLCLSFCAWEILFHLARHSLKKGAADRILGAAPSSDDARKNGRGHGHADGSNGRRVRRDPLDEARRTLVQRGPSYAVSLLHSGYVTLRGTSHLCHLWSASRRDQLIIAAAGASPHRGAQIEVARTNAVFLAYLLYDLLHILLQYPRLGGLDTVLHHAAFAACSVINGGYGILPFAFGWLIVGEGSTVFLNVRWFLLKSGRCGGGAWARRLDRVNTAFAATFFLTRVGVYSVGVVHLFGGCRAELRSVPAVSGVPVSLFGVTCGCMLLGWVLNVFWGYKIMGMVLGKSKQTTKTRKDPQSKLP